MLLVLIQLFELDCPHGRNTRYGKRRQQQKKQRNEQRTHIDQQQRKPIYRNRCIRQVIVRFVQADKMKPVLKQAKADPQQIAPKHSGNCNYGGMV